MVYKYGKVTLPDETKINSENKLNLKFEYDILENNGIPKERFNDDFFKLIGDILYHIIVVQTPDQRKQMNQTIEKTTLSNLVFNEDYCKRFWPKPDYFDIREERIVFEEITNFVDKYKKVKVSLEIEIENRKI